MANNGENSNNTAKAATSTVAGGLAGAATHAVVGNIGIAAGGTAVGVGLAPFVLVGAGLGAIGYGLYKLGKQSR